MVWVGRKEQARAGLIFTPRVVVVLKFGTKCEIESVGNECECISKFVIVANLVVVLISLLHSYILCVCITSSQTPRRKSLRTIPQNAPSILL